MRVTVAFILAAAAALGASAATAAPTTFTGSYDYSNNTGDGLITTIQNANGPASLDATAPGNRTFSFSLSEGGSMIFDLFNIFTTENSAEIDDYIPRAISVAFSFANPTFSGSGTGETYASLAPNLRSEGVLDWDNDGIFNFSYGTLGDGILTLRLTDAVYNRGSGTLGRFLPLPDPFDLDPGASNRASVTAMLTLTKAATEVPEPGMLGLFGLGIAGMAVARRRRLH